MIFYLGVGALIVSSLLAGVNMALGNSVEAAIWTGLTVMSTFTVVTQRTA